MYNSCCFTQRCRTTREAQLISERCPTDCKLQL
jgi:hypothetical protein